MVQPLVLLVYERLLPAGQLVQKLQDLGYRVQSLADVTQLLGQCERDKPLLVIIDLEPQRTLATQAIQSLRQKPETSHIPVIAFGGANNADLLEAGRAAGATLAVNDGAIVLHLHQFLEQALQVD